jgi:hypothetical protein
MSSWGRWMPEGWTGSAGFFEGFAADGGFEGFAVVDAAAWCDPFADEVRGAGAGFAAEKDAAVGVANDGGDA